MTIEDLIHALELINERSSGDREVDHIEADNLLMDYINDDRVRKAFDEIYKWYA